MKRVLFGYIMDGKAGGIDKYMLNFFQHIPGEDVHFDFLTAKIDEGLKEKLKEKNAEIYEIPTLKNPFAQYNAIREIIKKNDYDTAYFNISTALCFPGIKAAHDCGVNKIIIHSHNTWYDCNNSKKRFIMVRLNNICRKFIYKYGTDFYGCSVMAGKWIFPDKIVNSDKFKVIKNAINLTDYTYSSEKRKKIRSELGIDNKFVIGNVGNFLYQKNHYFIIKTFKEICDTDNDAHLLLVGDGLLFDAVKSQAKELGIYDRITFTGRKTNAFDYMMAMDVYVMPSLFEGFGIAAIEAEATGLMCFLSNHIPSDAKITENCKTLSIDNPEDAKIWANEIGSVKGYKRIDRSDEIRKAGYDLLCQDYIGLV